MFGSELKFLLTENTRGTDEDSFCRTESQSRSRSRSRSRVRAIRGLFRMKIICSDNQTMMSQCWLIDWSVYWWTEWSLFVFLVSHFYKNLHKLDLNEMQLFKNVNWKQCFMDSDLFPQVTYDQYVSYYSKLISLSLCGSVVHIVCSSLLFSQKPVWPPLSSNMEPRSHDCMQSNKHMKKKQLFTNWNHSMWQIMGCFKGHLNLPGVFDTWQTAVDEDFGSDIHYI